MTIERRNPDNVYTPFNHIYTQVVRATGATQVHVAGTVGMDTDRNVVGVGDMATQVRVTLENIRKSLAAGGAAPADVVRINVYTLDVDRYIEEGTPLVIEFFGDARPASTTVAVSRLVHPDWLVEIEATAIVE